MGGIALASFEEDPTLMKDATGREVLSARVNAGQQRIAMPELAPGTYTVVLNGEGRRGVRE